MNEDNHKEDSDEISLDFSIFKGVNKLIIKYWPYLLLLVPILLTIFVRSQSLNLTITNDWAKNNIYNYYMGQIYNQISQQYPNLPPQETQSIVDQKFKEFIKDNKELIEQQIPAVSNQFKQHFQYDSGSHSYPYMGDIDSYYWLRQARNIIEKGTICDEIEDGVCYDTYTLAPLKIFLPQSLHPYSIAFLYKIVKPFNKDITLMQAQILVPTIFAIIIVLLVFLMMLKAFNPLAALVSSILITINPIFLSRSLGSDSDIYNIFFPILIIFFAFEAFSIKELKNKIIFSALTGISIGVYSFAWSGWWYLFDFIVIAILGDYLIFLVRHIYINKKFDIRELWSNVKTKEDIILLVPLIFTMSIIVTLVSGISSLSNAYLSPFTFITTKAAANPNIWPNVLTTVAEFNPSSIPQIINQMGGSFFFFLALIGFVLVVYKSFKNILKHFIIFLLSASTIAYLVSFGRNFSPTAYSLLLIVSFLFSIYFTFKSEGEYDLKLSILFFVWVIASIYAAIKGIRFTLLLVVPIAIGIGISLGFLHKTLTRIIANSIKLNRAIVSIVLFIFFIYFFINPVKAGISTAKSYLPNVDDQWWEALTKIKANSKPDAIINSWWDFGHWFKYIADRRVTLDGSSQNNPQLHWLGKTLLTSSEREAIGILRMLDCGGNKAFDTINIKKNDTPKSINLLNHILLLEKNEAKKELVNDGFPENEAESVLRYSHCEPPENFFITSEDMIGKSGVWSHFGSWNFERALMDNIFNSENNEIRTVNKFIELFNLSEKEAKAYYSELKNLKTDSDVNAWIAPWLGYIQGETPCSKKEQIISCGFQQLTAEINLSTMDAGINTPQGIKHFDIFGYTTPTSFETKTYYDDTIGIGMVLSTTKEGYISMFMAPQLVNSIFTKLFFLDGHGTRYLEPFDNTKGISNFRIKTWKVNWQGRNNLLIVDRFNVSNANIT